MNSFYDTFDYPKYWQNRRYEDLSERIALKELLKEVNNKDSLIDIGGGYGRLSNLYSPFFVRCVVTDASGKLLQIGKMRNKTFKNLVFYQANLPDLNFAKDNSFDAALMIRVVHHLENPLPTFGEINRILKKNGYLIVEFANKIHFLAKVRTLFKANFNFVNNLSFVDVRNEKNIKSGKITFVNHHPKKILLDLKDSGFSVVTVLSVSNFRSNLLKQIIPLKFLLYLEKKLQRKLANFFFGPSIFVLCQKK